MTYAGAVKAIRRFTVRTVLPAELQILDALARNLYWSWHFPTVQFFASLDPEAWERVGHDPVALLGEISPERFRQLAADAGVVLEAQLLDEELRDYLGSSKWYQESFDAEGKPEGIAYFSAEFGITEVMPQYSGGLGILAGDHLKSASDLGVPIIGVGLLYSAGYFRQSLTRDGWQRETYPLLDPNNLPLILLRETDGTPTVISLPLPGARVLNAQVWVAQVGRVPLLLLDSNVPANDEISRQVTDRLYGGSAEHRLEQELLLGVGGVKALRAFERLTGGPRPQVYHCNEGHAGFLSVERLREILDTDPTMDFDSAVEAVRSATLFTTHTPVPAGIDRFDKNVVRPYLAAMPIAGVDVEDILRLGKETYEGGNPHVFNMAVLGLRMARMANGVARLHGHVSRTMFHQLWPGFDIEDVPITSITNGVHGPTWRDPHFQSMALEYMTAEQDADGSSWLRTEDQGGVPSSVIWNTRHQLRSNLVHAARKRMRQSWLERGASPAEVGWTETILDPDVLTIGFARRVPTYKRLTLMLSDPERLVRLLTDPKRPIQIIIAGKSHPDDEQGVSLIQRLVQFSDDPRVRDRIVFLPNYDMGLAHVLVPGCDVWLNNPLRPLEASGTSGMKCALNGALNLSILDGWWDEMYDGSNGWAIPTADGVDDPVRRDQIEAAALYDLIENTVAPRFYERDENGVPGRWVEMIRHTLATLGPKVQATRMVKDYVRELYTPIAAASRVLDVSPYRNARDLAAWKKRVIGAWHRVQISFVEATLPDVVQLGDEVAVEAHVNLGGLSPRDVQVQMVLGRVGSDDSIVGGQVIELGVAGGEEQEMYRFAASEKLAVSGAVGFAVRVVPHSELTASDAELGLVTNAEPTVVSAHTTTSFGQ
ncbi:alpha-glucan family phosphorylase [Actinomyces minihominis]|uniref:alpha-glucan family phosphorylase n=1 Tax=Actinomyces minihominis TaxID=2002838 RepID=UPI001F5D753D|nr:alpha-glucan family phosphorylase [Actinomyces minihominis]